MNRGASLFALGAALVTLSLVSGPAAQAQQLGPPPQLQTVPFAVATPVAPLDAPVHLQPMGVRARNAVEVHFLAYRGEDPYEVYAGAQHCSTPCTMVLPSGPNLVRTTGAGEFSTQLVVPHLPAQVRLFHSAPQSYFVAGAVLIPTGIIVAASMWALGFACGYSNPGCYAANFITWPVVGVTMLITGSVLMAIANRAPPGDANRAEILDARARPRVRFTDFAFGPTNGGLGGALTFAF